MKTYKPRGVVSRYYTILFTLPKWEILASVLILLSIALIVILGAVALPILLNALFTLIVLEIYSKIEAETVFYKFKRRVGLSLAVLVYTSIFTLITRSVYIAVVSSVTLLTVVIMGLDGTQPVKYIVPLAPPLSTLLASWILKPYAPRLLAPWILAVFTLVFLDVVIYAFMSRRRIGQYPLPDLGTMFLRNWLDKRMDIEKAFNELGEIQHVHPRIIELGDLAVVYTDVHYGPFSNIGSSRLPIILSSVMEKVGYKTTIALHGLGSHDRNIASSEYLTVFINELLKTISENKPRQLLYYGAFRLKHEPWEALTIVFNNLSLVIVSRPGRGIDDLPYNIQLEYELKAKSRNLGDVIIVDAHNWELQDESELIEDLDELRQLLDRVLDNIAEYKTRKPTELFYKYKCFKSNAPGLVDGDCCILCFKGESRESICLLYMRGNNMKPGARDKILDEMKILSVDYYETLSNDEHTETGTRAHIVYTPIHDTPRLLSDIRNVSTELSRIEWKKGGGVYDTRMELKLAGSAVNIMKKYLSESIRETAILLLLYVFATPIVLYLLDIALQNITFL